MLTICDTHMLIWWSANSPRLSLRARTALEAAAANAELAVADITLWEITLLAARGRIQLPVPVADYLTDLILALRLRVLPITPAIAVAAQATDILQGDPADRLILATAREERAVLLSADVQFRSLRDMEVVW